MPKAKPFTHEQILAAMSQTKSNLAASRWLNCSYQHYKKWAKLYIDEATGKTLFEKHLNPSGKGIPKFLRSSGKEPALLDIIEGRINASSFSPEKLKYRLVSEGYLLEECSNCGFHERRVLDYKTPLLLNFKDKNKKNYRKENIEFLCYNCYYLLIGSVFDDKQIEGIEDHKPVNKGQVDWELNEFQMQQLKNLGLEDDKDLDDFIDIVSYI